MIRLWDETETTKATLLMPVTHQRARSKRAHTAPTTLVGKVRARARKVVRTLARRVNRRSSRSLLLR
jgi:hypothetical protein